MASTYTIEARAAGEQWGSAPVGDARGWESREVAEAAIASLVETCPEFGALEFRVVEEPTYPIVVPCETADAALSRSLDDDGWIVEVDGARSYYPDRGGCWAMGPNGEVGRQTRGRLDVRAPRDLDAMRRFVRATVDR